jgi:hypothetical protein
VFEEVEDGVEGTGIGFVPDELRDFQDVAGSRSRGHIVGGAVDFTGDCCRQLILTADPEFARVVAQRRYAIAVNKGWNGKITFLNPVISVDAATGSWLMRVASIIGNDPRAVYLNADMTYARTDQGWRIHGVEVHHGMVLSASSAPQT